MPPRKQITTPETPQHALDRACKELLPDLAMMQALAQCDNRMKATAKYLNLPPGDISSRNNRLHKRLQARLIHHGGENHPILTDIGRRYVKLADDILPYLQRFLDDYRVSQTVRQVKIATIHSALFTYGEEMKEHCRGIDLVFDTPETPEAVKQSISDRSFDIGIFSYQMRVRPPLYHKLWKSEKMVVAASKTWAPKLVDQKVTIERLTDSVIFVFYKGKTIERIVSDYLCVDLGIPRSRLRHGGQEIESIITRVEKGDGISILPLSTVKKNELIVPYELPIPMDPRPLSVIWHQESFDDPNIRKTLEYFDVFERTGKNAARASKRKAQVFALP
jgi:DNA-binding transcriptional LysR family regulator